MIAHRPSALAAITKMVVLNDGKVAAMGPRDEILRKVMMKPSTQGTNVEPMAAITQGERN